MIWWDINEWSILGPLSVIIEIVPGKLFFVLKTLITFFALHWRFLFIHQWLNHAPFLVVHRAMWCFRFHFWWFLEIKLIHILPSKSKGKNVRGEKVVKDKQKQLRGSPKTHYLFHFTTQTWNFEVWQTNSSGTYPNPKHTTTNPRAYTKYDSKSA